MYFYYWFYILAAILPAVVLVLYAYKQDQFPEPPRIVFKTFLFGCATILGIDLIIPVLDDFSKDYFKGDTYHFFDSFIRAAFVEEFFKACVLIFYCTRKTAFDEPIDGVVYGVAASLGFAAYENIDYVLYMDGAPSLDIALLRAYTAIPMHALCGVVMGFLISQSIFEKKRNYLNLFLAIFIPVGMHGLYNFSFASTLISYQIAYVILLVFSIRAYLIFKNLKMRQNQSIIFNKRYYNISLANFINASANTLIVFLVLNYLIHLIV